MDAADPALAADPARTALAALGARVAAGAFRPLGGAHAYDPAVARTYRPAAVLLLLAPAARPGPVGADVFLVQRSPRLRHHPGQIALPGGRVEADDADVVAGALRETHEEIGLAPEHVEVLGQLPPVLVPISRYVVTPVLGWTTRPHLATKVAPGEVLHTIRASVDALLDPAARAAVTVPGRTGVTFRSAGFRSPAGWIWGFTGNLLDHVFTELGWTRPWDTAREVPVRYDARGLVTAQDD
ncbi:NUDIX hydrolase [Georgenia ruanii]|uniref:NUDIX domain-containing protein n=1 Tax=Georgenia ruanii TaxID=348442 RepID=A0A7J9USX1_9MICO|nr:CoA pyrophosphatase [Georgenia ruanii]MPV87443.1 NUDIX domain-containing protein [Georgenia ruanii]